MLQIKSMESNSIKLIFFVWFLGFFVSKFMCNLGLHGFGVMLRRKEYHKKYSDF